MPRKYGLPYKGSKSKLAERIVDLFPKKTNFYDLFGGGGAITHCALISGKFQNYHLNDIQRNMADTVKAVLSRDYVADKSWVTREDFFRRKDDEPLVKVCWSFGNVGHSYLYSKEIEPWKKAVHYARVFGDFSLLCGFGIETNDASRQWISRNKDYCKKKYIEWARAYFNFTDDEISAWKRYREIGVFDGLNAGAAGLAALKKRLQSLERLERLESLERLQSLERLERLQSLERLERLERLETSCRSYDEIAIKDDSVIYCDPPYKSTSGYGVKNLDYERFYDWCRNQKELLFISSYEMPNDFVPVAEFSHRSTINDKGNFKVVEKIFVHKSQLPMYNAVKPSRDLFDEVA